MTTVPAIFVPDDMISVGSSIRAVTVPAGTADSPVSGAAPGGAGSLTGTKGALVVVAGVVVEAGAVVVDDRSRARADGASPSSLPLAATTASTLNAITTMVVGTAILSQRGNPLMGQP
jgi:hypothetical protein